MVLMVALTGNAAVPDCHRHRCHGCSGGCYSGCYGGGCYGGGCYGGWGGCHGGYGGCYGGGWGGCYGGGCGGGMYMVPKTGTGTGGGKDGKDGKGGGKGDGGEDTYGALSTPTPATLIVSLPPDAKLTVDGAPTTSTSATRRFTTPPLQPGRDFTYTLQAQVTVDGKAEVITKQVIVRAGQETQATLSLPTAAASAR
jgi:uncharacterized protein (TIGR03000 family)